MRQCHDGMRRLMPRLERSGTTVGERGRERLRDRGETVNLLCLGRRLAPGAQEIDREKNDMRTLVVQRLEQRAAPRRGLQSPAVGLQGLVADHWGLVAERGSDDVS